jgi:hypothetical protein
MGYPLRDYNEGCAEYVLSELLMADEVCGICAGGLIGGVVPLFAPPHSQSISVQGSVT